MKSREDPAKPDGLGTYRSKRSADRSPEPLGTLPGASTRAFVVHKHAARQLHYDLRLEMDGVLLSWAVPKGPSYDMSEKRLAVHVEDHPVEYAEFEGVIPEGNYGAGGMIVWDRGEWVPLEDPRSGLEKGKLLFELRGYKLRGKWTLVKIKKGERDWLLIKERDAWTRRAGEALPEESVLSGLTVEEMAAGMRPGEPLRKAAEALGARVSRVAPREVRVMLAEPAGDAFTRDGWIFELKLDGYRLLAAKQRGEALLLTRNGNDYTRVFPDVARAVEALPLDDFVLDGEVVVLDAQGRPSFSRLQKRGRLTSAVEIRRAAVELPAVFYAFDLLALEDLDLRTLPLVHRKSLLAQTLPKLGPVRTLDHILRDGAAFLEQVAALGLEGIIAKQADAPYVAGRSARWLKIKAERTADLVIVGYTKPKGSRSHLGALQLADVVDGGLAYAGRVGTGFDEALLASLKAQLDPIVRERPACLGPACAPGEAPLPSARIPETSTTTWVEPRLVCEVRFREWTPDGVLRHAVFVRLRTDKDPRDCERQGWHGGEPAAEAEEERLDESPAAAPVAPARVVGISNPGKVYWPGDGYTKKDLAEYYREISPWLLPYLRNRPAVMTRFPDGIDGKSFYQKDAPEGTPDWIRTVPIWSEETQREIRYFVCDDEETLLHIANLGSIPVHVWASRATSLERPDWCVIDLDPKEAPFSDVVRTAVVLRRLCEAIQLPSFVKTTGKTGLHILLPLGGRCTYEQSRTLGELLSRCVLRELGEIATITRHVTRRGDKVYLDYLQNRHGQTIVAPFSVRPLPGATVSMPLHWDEVDASLDPRAFTIRNARERLERMGRDPMLAVLETKADLGGVLERLAVAVTAR